MRQLSEAVAVFVIGIAFWSLALMVATSNA